MKRRLRFEQEAEEDLERAIDYYRQEAGEDVALRFVDVAFHAFSLLVEHPEMGRHYDAALDPRLRKVRAWPLREFPYVVFYVVSGDEDLDVLAVVEAHQDLPELLRRRWT